MSRILSNGFVSFKRQKMWSEMNLKSIRVPNLAEQIGPAVVISFSVLLSFSVMGDYLICDLVVCRFVELKLSL